MPTWTVGTRASPLAMAQTRHIVAQLEQLARQWGREDTFAIQTIVTEGDRFLDAPLASLGGKGLFISEIEQKMMAGDIHLAVHSLKDMPYALPKGLVIGAVPERAPAHDVLIRRGGGGWTELPLGATVGTSSVRRAHALKSVRPDVVIVPIRGNVDTRLAKLDTTVDAVMLAAAGLLRLGRTVEAHPLPMDVFVPAAGQGALAIEFPEQIEPLWPYMHHLNDPSTRIAVEAERAFLEAMQGGCHAPIGVHVTGAGPYTLQAMVGANPSDARVWRHTLIGTNVQELVTQMVVWMREAGVPPLRPEA